MKTENVHLNGIELHYQMAGAGDPLLLLHGGGGCHEDWAPAAICWRYRAIPRSALWVVPDGGHAPVF